MGEFVDVKYRDRITGEVVQEPVYAERLIRFLYESGVWGRLLRGLGNRVSLCRFIGWLQDRPGSRKKVETFVAQYGIDASEFELPVCAYRTFNAFFTRKLKPETRPFAADSEVFCCPADGKVLVFPRLENGTRLPVKSTGVTVDALLASDGAVFHGGSALVVRLAPYDYHRYHFPDDGEAGPARLVPGKYHTVNPIALERMPDIFIRNQRAVMAFASENFGRIAYVDVGAFAVGRIVQTYTPGRVKRGEEKGYFRFGGSTLVLLFEPGKIVFDEDLIRDSEAGLEVHVQTGSGIGRRA
ncbi:MAG: archaetidylserine decarboxylase [bacterium]|nr:archaetidylserine decarboxylase [bacterium]